MTKEEIVISREEIEAIERVLDMVWDRLTDAVPEFCLDDNWENKRVDQAQEIIKKVKERNNEKI